MSGTERDRLAHAILEDLDARRPGDWAAFVADLSLAEAYAIQHAVTALRERRGERVVGYKVGCTSPVIQEQLGIHQPIFGRLFDTGEVPSGAAISHARYLNLAVEGELAVRLSQDLSSVPSSHEECLAAVDAILPVIELHHHALQCRPPSVAELVVRNGIHAGFVVGPPSHALPDEAIRELRIRIDDRVVDRTTEPWPHGNLAGPIDWLLQTLRQHDLPLRRGHLILTGSAMGLFPVEPGCEVTVEAIPQAHCAVTIRE